MMRFKLDYAQLKRYLFIVTVFVPVAVLYLLGGFEFLERRWIDTQYALTARQPSSGVVLVDIDPRSLAELDVWPWPRGYHATVLGRAEKRRIGRRCRGRTKRRASHLKRTRLGDRFCPLFRSLRL